MKMMQKHLLLALPLLLTAVPSAYAHKKPPEPDTPKTAPEVDPALAVSGLALLVGSLSVANARRSKG